MIDKLSKIKGIGFFLNNKKVSELILKSLLLLIIPYAYLMLCGLVFDYLLKWYFMTTFIFVTLILLSIVAVILIVMAFIKYFKVKK